MRTTPSQTVGPFFAIELPYSDGPYVVAEGTADAIWLRGRLIEHRRMRLETTPLEERKHPLHVVVRLLQLLPPERLNIREAAPAMIGAFAAIEGQQAARARRIREDAALHAAGSAVRMSGAPARITMVCS